jgi:hypothetical protein
LKFGVLHLVQRHDLGGLRPQDHRVAGTCRAGNRFGTCRAGNRFAWKEPPAGRLFSCSSLAAAMVYELGEDVAKVDF